MWVDPVVAIAWDAFKRYALVPIERGVRYVISSKKFANRLREEVLNLESEAQRVDVLAGEAQNNVRNFKDAFTRWKASADEALKEAQELLKAFDEESKTCCYDSLPDPKYRFQFSRKAKCKIEVVKKLAQDCSSFRELDDISLIDLAPGNVATLNRTRREGKDVVQSTTTTATKLGDDDGFKSRASMIRKIMDALADKSVVGVYGMGGVGKSTLLGDAEKKILEEKSFDWVAKADVSQNPSIKTIQEEIAGGLGLTDMKKIDSIKDRAELLRVRLEKEEQNKKNVLIILDNLWEGLDLNKVGIPCGRDNKAKGCKLLLTSRDGDVLRRQMGCDVAFPLRELDQEEAKILFERTVGDKVHDDEFKPWVEKALAISGGLPFLILAMARQFKDADLYEWKVRLKDMEKFRDTDTINLIHWMLQWSYDKLNEEEKSLLRLCAIYRISKPSLEDLLRYWVGLRLSHGSMEDARDRFKTHLRKLHISSLLLDSEDDDTFKIHDLVVQFVTSIASKDHPFLVLKDEDELVTELPKDKPNNYTAICFPDIHMEELPLELDCPELRIFLLFTDNESLRVPDSFFNSTRKLMILSLSGIHFTCFPSSFQSLEKLHTLSLNECQLDDIVILGELKGLQILSFAGSDIHQLPKEIGQLTKLILLDLNDCDELQTIEPGVLGRLTKLEELYMENSFDEWSAVDTTPATNANLSELNNMKNLCILHVSIPDQSVLPENLNVEKLTEFKISIGDRWLGPNVSKAPRVLRLTLDPMNGVLRKGYIQCVLGKTDNLFLNQLDGSEQSICELFRKGFPKLNYLQVQNSPSISYIIQWP